MFVKEPHGFDETPRFLMYVFCFICMGYNFVPILPFYSGNRLLFGAGLATVSGDAHRKQRKLLNPAFSPTHLRKLTPVFLHVGEMVRKLEL